MPSRSTFSDWQRATLIACGALLCVASGYILRLVDPSVDLPSFGARHLCDIHPRDTRCHYGGPNYVGYWAVPKMVYMHYAQPSCQLQPFAMQLQGANPPFSLARVRSNLPSGAGPTVLSWLTHEVHVMERLTNLAIVIIGDSLDRHLFYALCRQSGAPLVRLTAFSGTADYVPQYCRLPANNFTVINIHHFGVLQGWWPTTDSATGGLWTTQDVFSERLPAVLDALRLRVDDVTLLQAHSGLWDLHAKNSSFVFTPEILHQRWVPLMRQQLLDPLRAFARSVVVLRTCPPTNWPSEQQERIASLNDAMRLLAVEYGAQLLDMAKILAGRQSWVYDNHHYSEETELQRANLLLNIAVEHLERG